MERAIERGERKSGRQVGFGDERERERERERAREREAKGRGRDLSSLCV